MNGVILDNIPLHLDLAALMRRFHAEEGSNYASDLGGLVRNAQAIARPKALYRVAFVESKGEEHVIVNGGRLTSRVLRVNLEKAHRVFPYVATCGTELEEWSSSMGDVLHRYWADEIKELALGAAIRALREDLEERYRPGRTSTMSPGSLEDWPLEEQRALFAILGNVEEAIGVQLSESLVMIPTKSVSGIRFPTEESFESCQLCPRENCPGRRSPYDDGLYERKYARKTM